MNVCQCCGKRNLPQDPMLSGDFVSFNEIDTDKPSLAFVCSKCKSILSLLKVDTFSDFEIVSKEVKKTEFVSTEDDETIITKFGAGFNSGIHNKVDAIITVKSKEGEELIPSVRKYLPIESKFLNSINLEVHVLGKSWVHKCDEDMEPVTMYEICPVIKYTIDNIQNKQVLERARIHGREEYIKYMVKLDKRIFMLYFKIEMITSGIPLVGMAVKNISLDNVEVKR